MSSWFETDELDIRDDGAPADAANADTAATLREIGQAHPDARAYLYAAIAAMSERPPWPKGVYVTIKNPLQGEDHELIARETLRIRSITAPGASGATTEAEPLTYQAALVVAAVAIRGFKEPMKDGKPVLRDGKGLFTIDGDPVSFDGLTLQARVDLVKKLPAPIYTFVAREVDRLSEDPLGLRKIGKS